MTLQSDLQLIMHDQLEFYTYHLYHKGILVATEESEDLHKFGFVMIDNGEFTMLLRDSHADVVKLKDFSDSSTHILTVNCN